MSEWKTIDSAPKDGTLVILATSLGVVASSWSDEVVGFGNDYISYDCATHWMPMPPRPESTEWIPKGAVWLVFDLNNGGAHKQRYVWWFDSEDAANEHIAHHATLGPNRAELSSPMKFVPSTT